MGQSGVCIYYDHFSMKCKVTRKFLSVCDCKAHSYGLMW
jgi:hypothetical protein